MLCARAVALMEVNVSPVVMQRTPRGLRVCDVCGLAIGVRALLLGCLRKYLRLPSFSPCALFTPSLVSKMVRSLLLRCCMVLVLILSILFCNVLGVRIKQNGVVVGLAMGSIAYYSNIPCFWDYEPEKTKEEKICMNGFVRYESWYKSAYKKFRLYIYLF